MFAAITALLGLAVLTYSLNASDDHLPANWIWSSEQPASAIMVTIPALKLSVLRGPKLLSILPVRSVLMSSLNSLPV